MGGINVWNIELNYIPDLAIVIKSSLIWFSPDKDITSTLLKLSGVGTVPAAAVGTGKEVVFNEEDSCDKDETPIKELVCNKVKVDFRGGYQLRMY